MNIFLKRKMFILIRVCVPSSVPPRHRGHPLRPLPPRRPPSPISPPSLAPTTSSTWSTGRAEYPRLSPASACSTPHGPRHRHRGSLPLPLPAVRRPRHHAPHRPRLHLRPRRFIPIPLQGRHVHHLPGRDRRRDHGGRRHRRRRLIACLIAFRRTTRSYFLHRSPIWVN